MKDIIIGFTTEKLELLFKKWFKDVINEFIVSNEVNTQQSDRVFNVKKAAEFLDLKEQAIYEKTSKNEIPFHKPHKKLYFFESELREYIKSGRKQTVKEINAEPHLYLVNQKNKAL